MTSAPTTSLSDLINELRRLRTGPSDALDEAGIAVSRAAILLGQIAAGSTRAELVEEAEEATRAAREALLAARRRVESHRRQAREPRKPHSPIQSERRIVCSGCKRRMRVIFRSEVPVPRVQGEIACPWSSCGQVVRCHYPWSTFELWAEPLG